MPTPHDSRWRVWLRTGRTESSLNVHCMSPMWKISFEKIKVIFQHWQKKLKVVMLILSMSAVDTDLSAAYSLNCEIILTEIQESILQVPLHFLLDAFLHIIWTVALVPFKNWNMEYSAYLAAWASGVVIVLAMENFMNAHVLSVPKMSRVWYYQQKLNQLHMNLLPFCRCGMLFSVMIEIHLLTSVPFLFTPASYSSCGTWIVVLVFNVYTFILSRNRRWQLSHLFYLYVS